MRPNLSIGDTISPDCVPAGNLSGDYRTRQDGKHQGPEVVDVAHESIFNLMGVVQNTVAPVSIPSNLGTVTGIVLQPTYRCQDGKYVVIGGNGDSVFQRQWLQRGFPGLATDVRLPPCGSGRLMKQS